MRPVHGARSECDCKIPVYDCIESKNCRIVTRIDKARDQELKLEQLRKLIADDGYAMTFQSLGQYRTALLKELDRR